jgi:hypothetical protein
LSAFQAYAGAYGHEHQLYRWSCYATSRVYEVRSVEHLPLPAPPVGRKWVTTARDREPAVAWLVDDATAEFSQILLQIKPPRTARR